MEGGSSLGFAVYSPSINNMKQSAVFLAFALTAGCLRAAQTGARIRESFNQAWLFERQSTGSGALGSFDRDTSAATRIEPRFKDAMRPGYDDSGWQRVDIPHTWNAFDVTDAIPGYWRGIGWYRKHFTWTQNTPETGSSCISKAWEWYPSSG